MNPQYASNELDRTQAVNTKLAELQQAKAPKRRPKRRTCAGVCGCKRCEVTCPHYCIGGRNCCKGEICQGAYRGRRR